MPETLEVVASLLATVGKRERGEPSPKSFRHPRPPDRKTLHYAARQSGGSGKTKSDIANWRSFVSKFNIKLNKRIEYEGMVKSKTLYETRHGASKLGAG